jgi:hypothetical protein
VLKFIRSQIKRLDKFHDVTEDAVDSETTGETYISGMEGSRYIISSGNNHVTILGSKKEMMTIREPLDTTNGDVAFTSFCSRVSQAIQAFGYASEDAIAINDSHRVLCFMLSRRIV